MNANALQVIFVAGAKGQGSEKNRKVYAEAVGELASLSAAQGVSKFILLSSGGVTIEGYQPTPNQRQEGTCSQRLCTAIVVSFVCLVRDNAAR